MVDLRPAGVMEVSKGEIRVTSHRLSDPLNLQGCLLSGNLKARILALWPSGVAVYDFARAV